MTRALVLSGGGAKGAFTVGALKVMHDERPDLKFDIFSGSSTGALIASLFIIGEIEKLKTLYLSVENDDIVLAQDPLKNLKKDQPFIFSDAPLTKLVKEVITEEMATRIIKSPKMLFLTAINLQTGRITVFSNKVIDPTNEYDVILISSRAVLIDAMRASSNQAVFLPPVDIKDNNGNTFQFIDGGNREVIPCLAVLNQNPTEIYVLSNNPKQIFPEPAKFTSIMKILFRSISIFIQDVRENDMVALERWAKSDGRNVPIIKIDPEEDLDRDFPTGLRFEPFRMGQMMSLGGMRTREILGIPITESMRVFAPTASGASQPAPARKRSAKKAASKKTATKKAAAKKATKPSTASSTRCTAMTNEGKRCKNKAVAKGLCGIHRKK